MFENLLFSEIGRAFGVLICWEAFQIIVWGASPLMCDWGMIQQILICQNFVKDYITYEIITV